MPFGLFTDPELARVGLSVREARDRGVSYCLAKVPMGTVFRAQTLSETRGFLKALIEKDVVAVHGLPGVKPTRTTPSIARPSVAPCFHPRA